MTNLPDPALSFGAAHAAYERGRPEYPAAALEWLLPARPGLVADVGAGTGKLSRGILAAGHRVVAVDPDPAMLGALRQATPGVATLIGTGEELPLEDASIDTVVYGQSWHWVDPQLGSAEAARVLRPGGRLGLIWNTRDGHSDLVRQMTAIMGVSNAEQLMTSGGPTITEPFGEVRRSHWRWTREMSVEEIVAMANSRSALILAEASRRAQLIAELRALLARHPESAGRRRITIPYLTRAFRAEAPAA